MEQPKKEQNGEKSVGKSLVIKKVNIAPPVKTQTQNQLRYDSSIVQEVYHNPEYEAIWAPTQGPIHPILSKRVVSAGQNNSLGGYIEDTIINPVQFNEQYHNFSNKGYAIDPNGNEIVGKLPTNNQPKKRKKGYFGDASDVSGFQGPWALFEDEEEIDRKLQELSDRKSQITEEEILKKEEEEASKKEEEKEEEKAKVHGIDTSQAKSIWHLDPSEFRDYLGRTFVDPPTHLKNQPHECFLPKKCIQTWNAHTGGVSAVRFFPNTGHVLLSAGMDTKIKIWDIYNHQSLLRSYMGHSKSVKDICFNNDGTKFLSSSYDKHINLWDTETGALLGSYTNGKIAHCVKFNPSPSKQNLFLAGCSDKRIIQWDINSGKIVQEYDQHLGAVNTITFIDDARRFITSSDDKSIRIWEWGIPVVIKYISEPHMHSMPSIALHPNGKWFVGQSLDNQILVYSTRDRFRQNKKKTFKGHLVAGYACQVNFSPDGHWIMSGDSEGKLWFWDWKTGKNLKTLKCHDKVLIGCEWHPIEPSRLVTASWDGTIKYWD